ncbi:hypothetical protein CPB84DRAFT_1844226 [Gymnopilus junonius]|uniref:Uncharacterized protein n=1 Tax=Gymnopilus junonius TaxID=109634 RepID=A0A9P5NX01_GYMJU|nr:hypothetical protein CPB84DRAFT_1844226 [Gymnopilus junonius]
MSSPPEENPSNSLVFRLQWPIELDSQNHATSAFGILELLDDQKTTAYTPTSSRPGPYSSSRHLRSQARRASQIQSRGHQTELSDFNEPAWSCQPHSAFIAPLGVTQSDCNVAVLSGAMSMASLAPENSFAQTLLPLQPHPYESYASSQGPLILLDSRRDVNSQCGCLEPGDEFNQHCCRQPQQRPRVVSPVYSHALLQPIRMTTLAPLISGMILIYSSSRRFRYSALTRRRPSSKLMTSRTHISTKFPWTLWPLQGVELHALENRLRTIDLFHF